MRILPVTFVMVVKSKPNNLITTPRPKTGDTLRYLFAQESVKNNEISLSKIVR